MASKDNDKFHTVLIRIVVIVIVLMAAVVLAPYFIVNQYHKYTVDIDSYDKSLANPPTTAIVLGSGVRADGTPSFVLQSRLDSSFELYEKGYLDEIVLSGYNPKEAYNEPVVMKNYLVGEGVADEDLIEDDGGHNTLGSCQSARQNLNIERAVIITQPGHLDRAIYLCRSLGIEAYGVESLVTGSQEEIYFQSLREAGSNIKAVFEISILKLGLAE